MTSAMMQTAPPAPATRKIVRVRCCRVEQIAVGMGSAFDIEGRSIAVFRTRTGAILAVDNECPHGGGPLADGILAGEQVVCPLHAFRFKLDTGASEQEGVCNLNVYPAEVRDGWVFIRVPVVP